MIDPPLGELQNKVFHFPVRVYYEDTDQQGIVFYANYLKYLERGRTELLRYLGAPPTEIEARFDRLFVIAHIDMTYHRSAHLDEVLMVQTSVKAFGRVKLSMDQIIYRGEQRIVSATVTLAIVNGAGRPARLEGTLEDKLRSLYVGYRAA